MKRVLICTVGLPRSGKSTWAQAQGYPIVCPDAIRLALHGVCFIASLEPYVWAIAETMVRALFRAGHEHVILDATNCTGKRRETWKCHDWQTFWKVIPTPATTCRERAIATGDFAILDVIDRMAGQFEPRTKDETEWNE